MTLKDMLGRSGVLSREDALKILSQHLTIPSLPEEEIHLSAALGRVISRDIVAAVDIPAFDRSTMDGYAVKSSDTFGASEAHPALFTVIGDIPMGVMPETALSRGAVMKIATGGALPPGADAVVMFEHTEQVDGQSIEVMKAVAPQENITLRGEDLKIGEPVLTAGHVVRPQDMGVLASLGITRPWVYQKPPVAIISTGNELIPADRAPQPGQIRDSNSFTLEGLITQTGGVTAKLGIIADDALRLRAALERAREDCRIILFTGGSSVGTADYTAQVINELGPPGVLVHGVSIKPGKPLVVGMVQNKGGDHLPVFGLPGHPAAVVVCFEFFVKPVLRRYTGAVTPPALEGVTRERTVTARLVRSISSAPGREDHVRVVLEQREGGLWARPVFGASGLISTLVKAVGTVVVPVNSIGIAAGEEVEVRLF